MKLIVVRHGETDANVLRICQGQTNGQLNSCGIIQAEQTALHLKNEKIDVCYSSDLTRAMKTAQIITKFHPHLSAIPDKRLRERYFGSFQGKRFPKNLDNFLPPKEAESPEEIAIRLQGFLNDIYQQHSDRTVLIVSHGFTICVLFSLFLDLKAQQLEELDDICNASISVVEMNNNSYKVDILNDTSHLCTNQ